MNEKDISRALGMIDEKFLAEAENYRRPKKSHRGIVAAAAAAAVVLASGTAVAAGGGLVNIKNRFGAIIGQEYVGDATDDFNVSVRGISNGGIELQVEKTDPDSKLDLNGCVITPLSYHVCDSAGNTVMSNDSAEAVETIDAISWWSSRPLEPDELLSSPEELKKNIPEGYTPTDECIDSIERCYSSTPDGKLNFTVLIVHHRKYVNPNAEREDFREMFFPESDEILDSGVYTLYLDSFNIYRKGDQNLEVVGKWTTEFEITDEPEDSTDDVEISFLGFENGEPQLGLTLNKPTEEPYSSIADGNFSVRPIAYEVTGAGELLLQWLAENGTDKNGIYFDNMHPLIAIGSLIDSRKMSDEELRETAEDLGFNFDTLEFVSENVGFSSHSCRSSDGGIEEITISRQVKYVDSETGDEISFLTDSETYEAKDLAPWGTPVNATGTSLDPTVPIGEEVTAEEEQGSATPEDGYISLDDPEPLTISVEGIEICPEVGGRKIELFGEWKAEME